MLGALLRWSIAVGATLAAAGAAGWFLVVPHWRPPLHDGEAYGIDVSHHQGHIDWPDVADDGITFAYIKASEGGDMADPRFADNQRGAAAAGVLTGAYHFFTLCRPGAEQADWFLSQARPDDDALPPAVDLELAGNCSDRPSAEAVNDELRTFLDIVEDGWGRRAILYVGDDYQATYPVPAELDRPRWQRRFLVRPSNDAWVVWQLHGYARVDGIEGDVDLDVARISELTSGG